MRYVKVKYPQCGRGCRPTNFDVSNVEKEYIYGVFDEVRVDYGDVVVCSNCNGYGVGVVVDNNAELTQTFEHGVSMVVGRVNVDAFVAHYVREDQIEELREEIDKKVISKAIELKYRKAAENDPELQEMLEKFKALGGEF